LGRIPIPFTRFYLPEAVPIVLFGTVAGWAYGTQGDVAEVVSGGAWIGAAAFEGFGEIGPYIGTVLPFSIAASFGDMMCLVSARKAGDPFPIRETMVSDGIGTLIGAFLGSPVGTVVYIGHPVHKRVGGRTGYSIINGVVYLIICTSGVIPVILSVIPGIAIGPIIFIFGLMICEECTKHIAQRHHSALFFGLFFGVTDYIFTQYQPADSSVNNPGTFAMSKGSALASMIWVSILVYTIDRRWIRASIFCVAAAAFAGIGIIHQSEAIKKFTSGTITESTSAFEFMMGYLSLAGVCGIYYLLQTYNPKKVAEGEEGFEEDMGFLPPIDDPDVDNIFETWWDPVLKKEPSKEAGFEDDGESP